MTSKPSAGSSSDGARQLDKVPSAVAKPRSAQLLADSIRSKVVSGELAVGGLLPKQDELADEYRVGAPTVRAALRILESEGLISVRRGRLGGAVIVGPGVDAVAATLDQLLRSRNVLLDDLGAALREMEPVAVGFCAGRADRHEAVVPVLRDVQERARECIDDIGPFSKLLEEFHDQLLALCGNQTVISTIGALEAIWIAQAAVSSAELDRYYELPNRDDRLRGLDDHELLIRLIERGDVEGAVREARAHMSWTPIYTTDRSRGEG